MVRSGWTENYMRLSQAERDKLKTIPTMEYTLVGAEQSEEMHDFLYDNYFAAVIGDAPAFEAWPPKREWGLHRAIIAMWGMPIGELWDLDRLAEICKKKNQYTFFVTSAPSNMPGKSPGSTSFGPKVTGCRRNRILSQRHGDILIGCFSQRFDSQTQLPLSGTTSLAWLRSSPRI
jgi:hypothetical protein